MTAPNLVLVETRPTRQVMPILAYLAALVMACLYISDIATARALASAADTIGAHVWQVALLLGALVALTGVALPRPRRVVPGLLAESVGAAMIAVQVAVYLATIAAGAGAPTRPWATLTWVGLVVCGGLAYRSVEAFRDRGRRLMVAAAIEAAK